MTDMRKLDLITTIYTLSILIPYFILMIKFNKTVAWILYFIQSIVYIAVLYYVHVHYIPIPMYKIIMDAAAILGAYFLIWSSEQLKYATTARRVEASVIMMLFGMFIFCITNTAIILPAGLIWLATFTWNRYYAGIPIKWMLKLKEKFTLTKYSLEQAKIEQSNNVGKKSEMLEVKNESFN